MATLASWITVPEIAKAMGVNETKILRLIASGEIAAVNVAQALGNRPRWRISPQAFDDFLAMRGAKVATATPKSRRKKPTGDIQFF
jgi:excisionase family DNA binding protein